jgi:hypothetical protein
MRRSDQLAADSCRIRWRVGSSVEHRFFASFARFERPTRSTGGASAMTM